MCENLRSSAPVHRRQQQQQQIRTGDAHCALEMCHSARVHGAEQHGSVFTTTVKEGEEGGEERWGCSGGGGREEGVGVLFYYRDAPGLFLLLLLEK